MWLDADNFLVRLGYISDVVLEMGFGRVCIDSSYYKGRCSLKVSFTGIHLVSFTGK
jgi:hypothetical protein